LNFGLAYRLIMR